MKTCLKCKESKTVNSFHNLKSSKDGKSKYCKKCKKSIAKTEYEKNKSTYKKHAKDNAVRIALWMKENRHRYNGKYKEAEKAWRKRNADEIKQKRSEYYQENKKSISSKHKVYQIENKDRIKAKKKEWAIANKDHTNAWFRNYANNRLKNDPVFAITKRLRTRMLHAINGGNATKNKNSIYLIGCTPVELKEHLQFLFTKGMTWDNYGEWHIDHIIPCAAFDLTKPEEQKACFHYSNLQPLWALDNLKKGAKIL